jgi:regulator of sigma E protease
MWIVNYLLPFLFVLSVLVFFHELGHFWVARRCGVKVETFSIGFGPEIFGFTDRHETRWRFSLIPLGGYVKMFGDANAASATTETQQSHIKEEDRHLTLNAKTPLQRIAVAFAGPLANYILAFVLLCGLIIFKGIPRLSNEIGSVDPAFHAAKYGLQEGDKILSVNGKKTPYFEDLVPLIKENAGKELNIEIDHKGNIVKKTIPMYKIDQKTNKKEPVFQLGIRPNEPYYEKMNPIYAVKTSLELCWSLSVQTFKGFAMLFQKNGSENLGGILSIGDMAGKSVQNGFSSMIWFMAVLSINLGFINLLPVPVVDGGHIFLNIIEIIRGRPIPPKAQERIFGIGFALVLMLMLSATWNDLKRYKVISWATEIFQKK